MEIHDNTVFRYDNYKLYYYPEEEIWGTTYADSIKVFRITKNGIGPFISLKGKYSREKKRQVAIIIQDELLHTRMWKGQ